MKRYKIAFAVLLLCVTMTLLSVPLISMSEARPGPWIGKTILYRSTTESLRISAVAAGALVDGLSAGAMAVLSANTTVLIEIWSGSAVIRAITGAAAIGDGEDLSAERVTNGAFAADTDWTHNNANTTIADGVCNWDGTAASSTIRQTLAGYTPAVGKLIKTTGDFTKASGTGSLFHHTQTSAYTLFYSASGTINPFTLASATGSFTSYRTAERATGLTEIGNAFSQGFVGTLDNYSMKEVTGPTTSGALLYNSAAMSVQSVMTNTFTSSDYLAATKTVIISKLR